MSFFRPNQPVTTPTYTGLQMQTSSGAIPIAIVYGVTKIAPNIIWNGGFKAWYTGGKSGSSGSKASGGSKGGAPSDYSSAVILALCEGPIDSVSAVWTNSTISPLAQVLTLPTPNFFNGATPQPAWSYLSTNFPSQALAYNGTAYVADYGANLGSSATLAAYGFELQAALRGTGANGYDADPALVVQDFLTNAQYGAGFPAASIAAETLLGSSGDSSYQSYCKATGLALSPALVSQEAANSILARWLKLTNTAAVWSSGLLKFVPYGDTSVTGAVFSVARGDHLIGFGTSPSSQSYTYSGAPQNKIGSWTFIPNLTPVYALGDDDFVHSDGKDPIEIERSDPYAAHNMQYLEIAQRSNYYDVTPIAAFDQNAIDLYGLRIASPITAHEICDPAMAQTAAQLILQRDLYIRNHYKFKLSWEYCLLEPMDLVAVTDANLGLSNTVIRIIEIEEDDNGLLSLTAEECPAGIATPAAYPVQPVSSGGIATNAAPAAINPPLIFEPPGALAGNAPQLWAAVSGGSNGAYDPNWGGANVWASLDDTTYTQIGQVTRPANQGALGAALPASKMGNPDTADALAVNLAESNGELSGTSQAAAQNAATLCIVDQEFLSFETATLIGANAYSLTGLYRGLYGSTAASHAPGAAFARIDGAIFKFALPANYIGQTIHLKFQSFNIFGVASQDLSQCAVYSYTPSGAGVANPIATQLESGIALDLGFVTQMPPAASGDVGSASEPVVRIIDLGIMS